MSRWKTSLPRIAENRCRFGGRESHHVPMISSHWPKAALNYAVVVWLLGCGLTVFPCTKQQTNYCIILYHSTGLKFIVANCLVPNCCHQRKSSYDKPHLIGGWATPLKNMSSSDWIIIPTIGENKSHVPNHQSVIIILIDISIYISLYLCDHHLSHHYMPI